MLSGCNRSLSPKIKGIVKIVNCVEYFIIWVVWHCTASPLSDGSHPCGPQSDGRLHNLRPTVTMSVKISLLAFRIVGAGTIYLELYSWLHTFLSMVNTFDVLNSSFESYKFDHTVQNMLYYSRISRIYSLQLLDKDLFLEQWNTWVHCNAMMASLLKC